MVSRRWKSKPAIATLRPLMQVSACLTNPASKPPPEPLCLVLRLLLSATSLPPALLLLLHASVLHAVNPVLCDPGG